MAQHIHIGEPRLVSTSLAIDGPRLLAKVVQFDRACERLQTTDVLILPGVSRTISHQTMKHQSAYREYQREDARLADILHVLGWTGPRWSEAHAARVGVLMRVPPPD